MDRERCAAVAMTDFAQRARDRIEVDADGRLQIWREFAGSSAVPLAGQKSLTFWLHFVPMPPHVGAVTSPQSMQSPLEVIWKPKEDKPQSAAAAPQQPKALDAPAD